VTPQRCCAAPLARAGACLRGIPLNCRSRVRPLSGKRRSLTVGRMARFEMPQQRVSAVRGRGVTCMILRS
jgi:hypothetical protein